MGSSHYWEGGVITSTWSDGGFRFGWGFGSEAYYPFGEYTMYVKAAKSGYTDTQVVFRFTLVPGGSPQTTSRTTRQASVTATVRTQPAVQSEQQETVHTRNDFFINMTLQMLVALIGGVLLIAIVLIVHALTKAPSRRGLYD